MVRAGFTLAIKKGGGGRTTFILGPFSHYSLRPLDHKKRKLLNMQSSWPKIWNGHYSSVYFCGFFSQLGRNVFAENENKETKK